MKCVYVPFEFTIKNIRQPFSQNNNSNKFIYSTHFVDPIRFVRVRNWFGFTCELTFKFLLWCALCTVCKLHFFAFTLKVFLVFFILCLPVIHSRLNHLQKRNEKKRYGRKSGRPKPLNVWIWCKKKWMKINILYSYLRIGNNSSRRQFFYRYFEHSKQKQNRNITARLVVQHSFLKFKSNDWCSDIKLVTNFEIGWWIFLSFTRVFFYSTHLCLSIIHQINLKLLLCVCDSDVTHQTDKTHAL